MSQLERSQIYPPTVNIKDPATKEWADNLIRFLDDIIGKIAAIPFNHSETLSVADTGSANATVTAGHHLNRVPRGVFVTRITKAGIIYIDDTDFNNWSQSEIKFKCSTTNALVELCVF